MGEVPGERLVEVMEGALGILVLMVDAGEGISGAACRLPELDAVLIAPPRDCGTPSLRLGARAVPRPDLGGDAAQTHRGSGRDGRRPRRAAGQQLRRRGPDAVGGAGRVGPVGEIGLGLPDGTAEPGRVGTQGDIVGAEVAARGAGGSCRPPRRGRFPRRRSGTTAGWGADPAPPPLFSKPFAEVLGLALEQGRVSVRRAAALVDAPVEELPGLMAAHGLEHEVEL